MQGLAQEVFAINPALLHSDATFGELAWVYGMDHHAHAADWRHRLWYDGDSVVAWGWIHLGKAAQLVQRFHPGRPEILDEILDWFAAESPDLPHMTTPRAADKEVRTAGDVGPAAVVKAHRDAWEHSRYTEQGYEGVRAAFPYREDLHILIETADGSLATSAIMWLDEKKQTAKFEPVGTHPDFRRQRLGRALLLHGMHKARGAGATRMLVGCASSPKNPAGKALYSSIGFREFTRDLPHRRAASS
jgi:GNAT superfamily N-acetyltransferase